MCPAAARPHGGAASLPPKTVKISGENGKKRAAKSRFFLLSEFERSNDRSVTLDVFGFEVVQKTAALTDHLQKTAAGVVIVLVHFEVFVEVVDALGEECDLDLGRTRVTLVCGKFRNDLCLVPFAFILLWKYSRCAKGNVESVSPRARLY